VAVVLRRGRSFFRISLHFRRKLPRRTSFGAIFSRVQDGVCSCPTPPIPEIRSTSIAAARRYRLREAAHSGFRQPFQALHPRRRNRGATPRPRPKVNRFSTPRKPHMLDSGHGPHSRSFRSGRQPDRRWRGRRPPRLRRQGAAGDALDAGATRIRVEIEAGRPAA